jgi:ATP-binding cassette subfamily D (ALD) protein 3
MRRSQQFRYLMGMIDTLVAKYFATVVGFWVISRPAFAGSSSTMRQGSMEDYYESARMLINLSGAVGRLVLAGRELTRLAGFTSRMSELMNVSLSLSACPPRVACYRRNAQRCGGMSCSRGISS